MRRALVALMVLALAAAGSTPALAGAGPRGRLVCPDADGDGICNGQDPDYVPGDQCTNPRCPNPTCPDADGDGICNRQDDDYVASGSQWRQRRLETERFRGRLMSILRFRLFGF